MLWALVLIHLLWKGSRERTEAEVDAVIQHYEMERDHYPDAAYRLGDDGEWFDDINQTAYEAKPKRRLSP